MKKRIAALSLIIAILMLTLGGCSDKKDKVTVESASVPEGLYVYYLDKVISCPEDYGLEKGDGKGSIAAALESCKKYAAAESFLSENSLSLTTEGKRAAAAEVETLWSLYKAYYEKIGVTKPDLTLAVTHEYRIKRIVDYYYGEAGLEPIDEADLKEEFVDLYVGFRAVTAPLTKTGNLGETVPLSDREKAALLELFRSYRNEINDGTATIDEINVRYSNTQDIIVTENLEINVVKIGDPMYTEEFFLDLEEISHTKAGIIECGNTLYLLQREKIATTEEDEFHLYRTELIEELKMDEIEGKIAEAAKALDGEADKDWADDLYDSIYQNTENEEISKPGKRAIFGDEEKEEQ